jgi:hypothetical protein
MYSAQKLLRGQLELARSFLYTAEVADDPQVQDRNIALAEHALSYIERCMAQLDLGTDIREACEELCARSRALKS